MDVPGRHNGGQWPGAVTGAATIRGVLLGGAIAVVAGLGIWLFRTGESARPGPDIAALRGEPIVPLSTNPAALAPVSNRFGFAPGTLTNVLELAGTNAALAEVAGLGGEDRAGRRKRAKPGSYPKRMMDLQMRLVGEGKDPRAYDTNALPPGFVITNLPPPEVEGYLPVSFGLLAGFEFDLRPEVVRDAATPAGPDPGLAQVPPGVRALDTRKIAISGFLLPMLMDEGRAVEFLLMRDQTLCCFGRVPRINEWISVRASGRGARPRMDVPLTVCGTFRLSAQRESGTLIGLYQMEAEKLIEPD